MNRSYSKKRHINLVNEALEQAYLEKKNNQLNEADPTRVGGNIALGAGTGAATGAAIGSVVPGIGTAIGAVAGTVIGGAAAWFGTHTGAGGYDGVQAFFQGCQKDGIGKPTMSDSQLSRISDNIVDALEGWGTNESSLKSSLEGLQTIPDFCRLIEIFEEDNPGEELLDYIDGDIDGNSDWTDYVYKPLLNCKRRTEELIKKAEGENGTCGKEPKKYEMCYTAEDILEDGAILYPGYFCDKENNAIIMMQKVLALNGMEIDEVGWKIGVIKVTIDTILSNFAPMHRKVPGPAVG